MLITVTPPPRLVGPDLRHALLLCRISYRTVPTVRRGGWISTGVARVTPDSPMALVMLKMAPVTPLLTQQMTQNHGYPSAPLSFSSTTSSH